MGDTISLLFSFHLRGCEKKKWNFVLEEEEESEEEQEHMR